MKRDDYLGVSWKPMRSFHDSLPTVVDVTVTIRKGRQFLFGELYLKGLASEVQSQVMSLWKLSGGAPMNESYIEEYLRSALQVLRGEVKGVSREMRIRPGTNITDVIVTFRQPPHLTSIFG